MNPRVKARRAERAHQASLAHPQAQAVAPLPASMRLVDRLLPLQNVIEFAGMSKSTIYKLMRRGEFPHPYKPGGHASRWSERELLEWQTAIAAARPQR